MPLPKMSYPDSQSEQRNKRKSFLKKPKQSGFLVLVNLLKPVKTWILADPVEYCQGHAQP